MPRPLKFDTTLNALKEMSDTDMQFPAHLILTEFASTNTGTGTLALNPVSNTGLTLIGTFTDTERPYNIGDHPVGTDVVSVTYQLFQDRRAVTNAVSARPIEFVTGQGLKEQTDAMLQSELIDMTLDRLTSNGLGAYRLEPTAPSVGGTWVAEATITNEITGSSNNATYLWRRTDQTVPTESRPLKMVTGQGIKELSNSEITSLTNNFRNSLVTTGKGLYALQSSTPVGGTWVQVGSTFSDTRQQLASNNYTGEYTSSFLATSYVGSFNPTYSSSWRTFYNGFGGTWFTSNYAGPSYITNYAAIYSSSWRTFYNGFGGTWFTSNYSANFKNFYGGFTGNYIPSYSTNFSGVYAGNTIQSATETSSSVSLWIRTS